MSSINFNVQTSYADLYNLNQPAATKNQQTAVTNVPAVNAGEKLTLSTEALNLLAQSASSGDDSGPQASIAGTGLRPPSSPPPPPPTGN